MKVLQCRSFAIALEYKYAIECLVYRWECLFYMVCVICWIILFFIFIDSSSSNFICTNIECLLYLYKTRGRSTKILDEPLLGWSVWPHSSLNATTMWNPPGDRWGNLLTLVLTYGLLSCNLPCAVVQPNELITLMAGSFCVQSCLPTFLNDMH